MRKKNFTRGLNTLLGEQAEKETADSKKRGRPITQLKEVTNEAERGTLEGETRATFILNKELIYKLKAVAYYDRVMLKEAVTEALQSYIDKKKPKPRPEEVRKKDQAANQKLIRIGGNIAELPKY